ncbi:MAG TPA: 23S rRNA (pseudouridine(1915)-N(3))-methyltransferase RlmH [Candidatus Xenobia bacterium]|nr:23S rRNA (pseudouridine(1915)-N(3))-methyltransferase RlmH [Candidatus Xenobia bacterium]
MRIQLIFLGKTRNAHVRALLDDYQKRIARFSPIEVLEWKTADGGPWSVAEARGKGEAAPVVLLDSGGTAYSSEDFARWLARKERSGARKLVFLVGGAEGFADETKRAADELLSLGPMTLPHELARVVLLEQLYRAFAFLRDHPYPK